MNFIIIKPHKKIILKRSILKWHKVSGIIFLFSRPIWCFFISINHIEISTGTNILIFLPSYHPLSIVYQFFCTFFHLFALVVVDVVGERKNTYKFIMFTPLLIHIFTFKCHNKSSDGIHKKIRIYAATNVWPKIVMFVFFFIFFGSSKSALLLQHNIFPLLYYYCLHKTAFLWLTLLLFSFCRLPPLPPSSYHVLLFFPFLLLVVSFSIPLPHNHSLTLSFVGSSHLPNR